MTSFEPIAPGGAMLPRSGHLPGAHYADWLRSLQSQLDQRRADHLLRELHPSNVAPGSTICLDGREYLQFCSNNYLGLAADPRLIEAAREATSRFGTGSGASRLVAGSLEIHQRLEAALARLKNCEAALLFPSGYMANLAALSTFASPQDTIVSDKLNHASLLDAAQHAGAMHRTFPHRRYARAAELLARAPVGRRFLVTDALFSMDGDVADLPVACSLAEQQGALMVIDDAHGTGVLGATGAGLAELQGVEGRIALTVGTLSKALGSVGGFIAGPQVVINTLINAARPFIYTTALPAGPCAAALAALEIVAQEPERRARVLGLAERLRQELRALEFDCGDSQTPIVPVMLGPAAVAVAASGFLKERGLYIPAIRPPTVAPQSARLRISLMATHTDGEVERLIEGLRELRGSGLLGR